MLVHAHLIVFKAIISVFYPLRGDTIVVQEQWGAGRPCTYRYRRARD